MCGRFSFSASDRIIEDLFGISLDNSVHKPRYNCAPSQMLAVITSENPGNLSYLKWGLVPFWAKEASIGNKLINAKAETITEKPSFRQSFANKRCLVPADGFYEWKQNKEKIPYRMTMKDDSLFAMAGLWSRWKDAEGRNLDTFTIITTAANELMQPIHHRMPVILDMKDYQTWLGEGVPEQLLPLLRPFPEHKMKAFPVSKLVNSPVNDYAGICMEAK
jgi:putative SOS response-associated peptidase YedK